MSDYIKGALKFLTEKEPLTASVGLAVGASLWCWIGSLLTGNCSQVDRLWSLLPAGYSLIFALKDGSDLRVKVVSGLVTVWGLRLTYNFWRKGGYKPGEEDYRWPILRKQISNKFLFQLFNLFFIVIFQNVLIWLFSMPISVAYSKRGEVPFGAIDIALTAAFLILLSIETIADQQQWIFQTKKHAMIKNNQRRTGAYLGGFLIDGLFKYSRHPNFFAEISLWWVIYGFSVAASGKLWNWTGLGAFLLTLLINGSTEFTESISVKKYPLYGVYQNVTSRLIPLPPDNVRRALLLQAFAIVR